MLLTKILSNLGLGFFKNWSFRINEREMLEMVQSEFEIENLFFFFFLKFVPPLDNF